MPDAPHPELGEDLAALVAEAGALRAATPLSRRGPDDLATAFHLRFADGSALKGVRLMDPDQAARVAGLAAALGDGVPRVLARRGAALLTEWIDGDALSAADCDDALLRTCGAWHGWVHALRPEADARAANLLRLWRGQLPSHLEALRAAGLLTAGEVGRLTEIAARHAPSRAAGGISLIDYCPDNIVRRASGVPCFIDIETLNVTPTDHDLARTWYRWPMSAEQRAVYLQGYRRHRDPAPFLHHRPFWMLLALAYGAVFRLEYRVAEVGVPLAQLRDLLGETDGER